MIPVILGVHVGRGRWVDVPLTPATRALDVVECCREPGERRACRLVVANGDTDHVVPEDATMLDVLSRLGPEWPPFHLRCGDPWRAYGAVVEEDCGWYSKLPYAPESSLSELRQTAARQQHQIEAQQQLLVAKEQRLRFLRQQEARAQAQEGERLRSLRERAQAQELKLRRLRALRGGVDQQRACNAGLGAELESIRALFNEKEKELSLAVAKVEELTRQLEEVRRGEGPRRGPAHSPAHLEFQRLKRELLYRSRLNEQQSARIAAQRESLSRRQSEISQMDQRIADLQQRLQRKRLLNQQLGSQLHANRARGRANVATVEPLRREVTEAEPEFAPPSKRDPKYQTLPHNTKFPGEAEKQPPPYPEPPSPPAKAPPAVRPLRGTQLRSATPCHAPSTTHEEKNLGAPQEVSPRPRLPPTAMTAAPRAAPPTPARQKPAVPPKPATPPRLSVDHALALLKGGDSNRHVGRLTPTVFGQHVQAKPPDAVPPEPGGVHISISRRLGLPPTFFLPDNQETPPEETSPLALDATPTTDITKDPETKPASPTEPLPAENIPPNLSNDSTDRSICSDVEQPSERPPMGAALRRVKKGNLKTKGTARNPRRVSFDPLALLLDAALEGELELVKKTAKEVPNLSAANDEGITALHNAICAGHLEIVKFLVEFGCDVNAQDSDGWTPLHCAASCNNLVMVKYLVERGACIFATTLSDHETAAEKCEEDEEGFDGCSEYLYSLQEKLGILNGGAVYALYDYEGQNPDELSFRDGDQLLVVRKGDELEREWWWSRIDDRQGYVPRNLLGLHPRVTVKKEQA